MKSNFFIGTVTSLVLFLFVSVSHAQSNGSDVYWRTDPGVETCSMVIDPSLTQAQWHRFVRQSSAILTFKSLAPATTLGKKKFHLAIDDAFTPVDQHDLAWINTFTHPDGDCPLGDQITFPAVRASMGVSDNMDVGGYWTVAPGANYGVAAGEFKYAFLRESEKYPAAAARASVSVLTGVPDFNLNIYSVDLIASKKVAMLTPYVGLKESLLNATETTSKVGLDAERLALTQGYVGATYSIWMLNLAAEYNVSSLNTLTFAIGTSL